MVAGEAGLIRSPLVRELALRELPSLSVLRPSFVFLPLPLFFTSPGFQSCVVCFLPPFVCSL